MTSKEFPNKEYNIIYADPPWSYNENWGNGAVHHHYDSLGVESLEYLPVQDISSENCHLYLWYTNSFVREAHKLCDAWGFKYKQTLTWVKQYKSFKMEMECLEKCECMKKYFRDGNVCKGIIYNIIN